MPLVCVDINDPATIHLGLIESGVDIEETGYVQLTFPSGFLTVQVFAHVPDEENIYIAMPGSAAIGTVLEIISDKESSPLLTVQGSNIFGSDQIGKGGATFKFMKVPGSTQEMWVRF